jgi:mannose-6-phosphate isomerase-like protein (cupin superfamily)
MAIQQSAVRVIRWTGGQHPTLSSITRQMQKEGYLPYFWENGPNYRYPPRTHGYHKVMYVVEGTLELSFPDSNEKIRLRAGDRVELPAGIRHAANAGTTGVKCVEAATRSS